MSWSCSPRLLFCLLHFLLQLEALFAFWAVNPGDIWRQLLLVNLFAEATVGTGNLHRLTDHQSCQNCFLYMQAILGFIKNN